MGIALAGNLVTFLIVLRVADAHRPIRWWCTAGRTRRCAAGKSISPTRWSAARVLLLGVVWLHGLAGPVEFTERRRRWRRWSRSARGELRVHLPAAASPASGVKAALVPLHGWLPRAMVAPAPVSRAAARGGGREGRRLRHRADRVRRLSACEFARRARRARSRWPSPPAVTIVYGSRARALPGRPQEAAGLLHRQPGLLHRAGRRPSSGRSATIGGLVHLVHQGLMKITLFFCAGNLRRDARHPRGQRDGRRGPAHAADHGSHSSIAALGMMACRR
ncbi:MAG: hypothetical protein MZW92_52950 [Comamonadaceae bacterium]|nr:hypothetical protein [Comamonadaceae bacterium]